MWKRPKKRPERFKYQRGKYGTTIIYGAPDAKLLGRCPLDGSPLYVRGKRTIICKNHKWILRKETSFRTGKVVGFSPYGTPLMVVDSNLYDKAGHWWKLE